MTELSRVPRNVGAGCPLVDFRAEASLSLFLLVKEREENPILIKHGNDAKQEGLTNVFSGGMKLRPSLLD